MVNFSEISALLELQDIKLMPLVIEQDNTRQYFKKILFNSDYIKSKGFSISINLKRHMLWKLSINEYTSETLQACWNIWKSRVINWT